MAHELGTHWPEAKKAEVVAAYLVLGKAPLVSAVTGVPADRIRQWKLLPWWKEMADAITAESDQALSSALQTRVEKILDVVQDRLENGEFVYNAKLDKIVRVPAKMRDAWKVSNDMIDVRLRLRQLKTETVDQKAVSDILKNLATEFAQMAKKRLTEKVIEAEVVTDGPELQEGVRQLSGDSGANPQAELAERSPSGSNESGTSPQGRS